MFGINGSSDGNSGPVIAPDPGAAPAGGSMPDPTPTLPGDAPTAPPISPASSAEQTGYTDATAQFDFKAADSADPAAGDAPADDPVPKPADEDAAANAALADIPAPHLSVGSDPVLNDVPTLPSEDELMKLKLEALDSLSPLVDKLDQTPEEKFKTTMMMLQASDNPRLVRNAYESANQIGDEKVRAQALLDVVNEINYFTQKNKGGAEDEKDA